jgi:hypothetical protein
MFNQNEADFIMELLLLPFLLDPASSYDLYRSWVTHIERKRRFLPFTRKEQNRLLIVIELSCNVDIRPMLNQIGFRSCGKIRSLVQDLELPQLVT